VKAVIARQLYKALLACAAGFFCSLKPHAWPGLLTLRYQAIFCFFRLPYALRQRICQQFFKLGVLLGKQNSFKYLPDSH
jgi:hypothetical protein